MRTLLTALLLAATAAVAPADDKETKAEGDLARLQGTWKGKGGQNKDYAIVMTIDGKKVRSTITTPQGKEFPLNGELQLDESAKPKRLDWVKFARPEGGEYDPNPAIYELDGDALKICQGGPGGERPADFKAGEDGRAVLLEFTRQKGEEAAPGDLKKVQGKWEGKHGGDDGTAIVLEVKDKSVAVTYTTGEGEERTLKGEIRLDESKSPRQWDWVKFDRPDGGEAETRLAIYKLDGDELTICTGEPGGDRPTEFRGGDAGPPILITFRRKP